jgi:methylthioribose-1-phosphate isomerase
MLRGRRNCMAVRTIEWRNGSVVMIDQRLLPQR